MMKKYLADIPAEFKCKIPKYTGISLQFSGITYKSPQYCSIPARKSLLKADIVALYTDGILSVGLTQRLVDHFELRAA